MGKKTFDEFNGGVKFGQVSIGHTTARLGVKIDRGVCDVSKADELFCNRRLIGQVVLGNHEDAAGQKKLVETDRTVKGVFDVKGFSVNASQIGLGLTFSLADIDISELAHFSAGAGRLLISEIGKIPDDSASASDEDDEEDDESEE